MSARSVGIALIAALVASTLGYLRLRQGLDLDAAGTDLFAAARVLAGESAHARMETGASSIVPTLLSLGMRATGAVASSWALLHAVFLAIIAGVGSAWIARRHTLFAAAWPLLLVAVAPLPLALAALLTTVVLAECSASVRRDRAMGASVAMTAILQPWWGLAAVGVAWTASARRNRAVGAGATAVLALGFVALVATGTAPETFRNTWIAPIAAGLERWHDLDLATLRAAFQDRGFHALHTGESIQAPWPWAGAARATGLLFASVLMLALLIWQAARTRRVNRVVALGIASLVALLFTRDLLVALLALPLLAVAGLPSGRRAIGSLFLLAALPFVTESLWLVANSSRETLGRSELERGGDVRWAPGYALQLGQLLARIPAGTEVASWPERPGLLFLADALPAVRWPDVPVGAEEDRRVASELAGDRPTLLLLPDVDRLPSQELAAQAPATWRGIRRDFRMLAPAVLGPSTLRVMVRDDDALSGLDQRLPRIEIGPSNDVSPALRRELSVGQSFAQRDGDFAGFAVRWSTRATSVDAELRVRVWQKRGDVFDALLMAETVNVHVEGEGAWTLVDLPVVETAGLELALTLELLDVPTSELRLRWRTGDGARDLYEEGSALLDLKSVGADLEIRLY